MHLRTFSLILAAAGALSAAGPARRASITVTNALDLPRQEVASLPWAEALKLLPGLDASRVAVRDSHSGGWVQVQVFDADGDGRPDELLFLATLAPGQSRRYELLQRASARAFPNRLQARFVPERKDDFVWENDRGAFRLYGPALAVEGSRGGVDVWSKRTRELVADRWYKTGAYHQDTGEGCDGYLVGPTLGCGGTGYLDAAGALTISPVYATQQLISAGPLRLAFTLTYPPLAVGRARVTETRRITMDLGENVFRVQASFKVEGDASGVVPVAGIRVDPGATGVAPQATATAWVESEKGRAEGGEIGEGLILPEGASALLQHGHILGILARDLNAPVVWHAGATWSKGLDYATPQAWQARITETAARLASPLVAKASRP